jgi:hypothetical protein
MCCVHVRVPRRVWKLTCARGCAAGTLPAAWSSTGANMTTLLLDNNRLSGT